MGKCRRCNVYVRGDIDNCPLCGAHVESAPSIFDYPKTESKNKKNIFLKVSLFLSLLAVAVCLVVDLAVNHTVSWSWHPLFGIALVWICIARPLVSRFGVRKSVSWGFFGIVALLFYLNGWINVFQDAWAFWLGAPIAVLVWQSIHEILFFAHKAERADYEMALTKLCLLSFICIGVSFAWLKNCTWGWYVCAGRGAIDVVAMSIFLNKKYFGELKRRLHV